LTGRIRAALDVEDRPAGRPVRDVTTDSLVAYELYVRGMDAWHNHRRSDARTLFEEAVRVDPTFALARSQLAVVLVALREPAAAQEHHRMVMAQLDRLPERQRLLVEAKQEIETNPSRARQLTERLLERYPDEEEAYDLIVHTYSFTRDPEYWKQTLAFMQRWARAIPGPGSGHFHNHYGYALIDHGLFAEAEREFRAYIRVSPDEANPYDSLAELFLLTGRPRDAIANYDRAIQLNPLFGSSYFGRAYATATLGRYDETIASMAKLQEIVARAGIAEATVHLASAFFYSRVGPTATPNSTSPLPCASLASSATWKARPTAICSRPWWRSSDGSRPAYSRRSIESRTACHECRATSCRRGGRRSLIWSLARPRWLAATCTPLPHATPHS
jgi:tetratricopeptide (TPR) repeat protein